MTYIGGTVMITVMITVRGDFKPPKPVPGGGNRWARILVPGA